MTVGGEGIVAKSDVEREKQIHTTTYINILRREQHFELLVNYDKNDLNSLMIMPC